MLLDNWKMRYPEDVQRYVNLNKDRIPFKPDVDYTGMFRGIIFPRDAHFKDDTIVVQDVGILGLFNRCKFNWNLRAEVTVLEPVVGGVVFVGCDFSDINVCLLEVKVSKGRIPGVFNSCAMPTEGMLGVRFENTNSKDDKYSVNYLFRGITFNNSTRIASLPSSSCADLNDVFIDCKFEDGSEPLTGFSLDGIEKFSRCSLFNNCSFSENFRLAPEFCSDTRKVTHTTSRIFRSCTIGGEKLEEVVGVPEGYLEGMLSQDKAERFACLAVVNEKVLEWMMLSPTKETLKGRFALTVRNLMEGGLDESEAIAKAKSMGYFKGISYARSVEPLLEKRIHRYLSDIDKNGYCRYNIGEVRERLIAEGFEVGEIEHGIVEALSLEYLAV